MKVNDNFDRNDAKRSTNIEFYLDRSILKPTNLCEFYHIDLIGLKVYDANNNFIGIVEEITNNNNLDQHLLFQEQQFNDFNPNISPIIGNEVFYNSTRVQLKNLK